MKHTLISCLVLLVVVPVFCQAQNPDSLINVLNTKKLTDDEKVDMYLDISNFYLNSNYDRCIEYSNTGLSIARKINDKRRIATFNQLLGISYYSKGILDTSYIHLNKFFEYAVKLEDNDLIAGAYRSIGVMYMVKKEYDTSADYYMKSLEIDTILQRRVGTFINLGIIHKALNHWDRATEYLNEALDIAHEQNLPNEEMAVLHTMGTIYLDKNDTDKSIDCFQKSLEISLKVSNIMYQILSTQGLAASYNLKKDYEQALKYASEALDIVEKSGISRFRISSWLTLADIYRLSGHYEECEVMASKVWALDSTSINDGGYAALNLAISNLHLGNKKKAEEFILRYQEIIFKGNDKQMNESLANMEVKYETEKKEMRIASLEKERQLYIWLSIACILLMLVSGIVLWQKIKSEQRKRQLAAANAVQEGEMGERERLAGELHDRLGGTLSAVKSELNNTKDVLSIRKKLDECIEEVRRITHNMMPLSLRFGIKAALEDFTAQFSNVHFHFFGEEIAISKRMEFVIYCCANELITNSLRHSGADNINLQLIQEENRIALTVQDDGCGFDKKSVKHGIGLKNINDRVASCNGKIEMTSSSGKGTETSIEFKP